MSDLDFFRTIAIDLDGPLYQFHRTYRYMMREYRGVDMPPVDEFWTHWDAPNQYTTQADREWIWSEGVKLGLFRHGHVTKHAVRALRALREAGYTLKVLTHRPTDDLTAQNDTYDWLEFHLPGLLSGTYIWDKPKGEFSDAFLLIDDKPENVEDWRKTSRPAYLFAEPWNEGADKFRFDGWYPILDYLRVSR